MQEVSISKFKATCLELLRKVRDTGQPILRWLRKPVKKSSPSSQTLTTSPPPSRWGGRTVPVLDALKAVRAARSFGTVEISVPISQGGDDAGPNPDRDCEDRTTWNEERIAVNEQEDERLGEGQ